MPKSAALVSAVDPYPTDAGKKVVLAGFNEYLTDRLGAGNVHYLMIGGRQRDGFPARLHPLPTPHPIRAVGNVLTRTTTGRASLQESLLRSADLDAAIQRTLERIDPDLEIYDTVRMAQYARLGHRGRQMCYLDDLFSERYRSMLRAAETYPGVDIQPLGNFAMHVPRPLRPLAGNARGQRLLLRLEQRLVHRSECRAVEHFEGALLVNEAEAQLLRDRTGAGSGAVRSIPPLISEPPVRRDYTGAPEFAFLGLLSLPHNDDGLRSFLREVWPRVLAARPDARLRVIGRDVRPGLAEAAAQQGDSVTLEGFVPDLGDILSGVAAMVNPLRFGSGVKLKIIESLGRGVPIVSTTVGSDGVASGPDEGVLVTDDHTETAELLLGTTNVQRNGQLSAAARDHFRARYSRSAVFRCYDEAFGLG